MTRKMPDRIRDTPMNVGRVLMNTPPSKTWKRLESQDKQSNNKRADQKPALRLSLYIILKEKVEKCTTSFDISG